MTLATVQCCPGDDGGGGPWPPPPPCVCCVYAGAATASDEATCCHICCDNKCDDGNPCTENDECDFGECVGTPLDCEDDNICTDDYCDGGSCRHDPRDGAWCDDGDPCTSNDRCSGTQCVGEPCPGPCCEGRCCQYAGGTCCGRGCCRPNETCCNPEVGECCTADQTCCDGVCGYLGACCFFDTGACTETTLQCCQADGGVYLGTGTTCTPADLCRPRCENCHTVSMTFYECFHPEPDPPPLEPCDQTHCIENVMMTASCDAFPHRLGPPKCNTFETLEEGQIVQTLYFLPIPLICNTTSPGDYHLWTRTFHGCGTTCVQTPHWVRCDTGPCGGIMVPGSDVPRGKKKACNACP